MARTLVVVVVFVLARPSPGSPLFPYTTLFRSAESAAPARSISEPRVLQGSGDASFDVRQAACDRVRPGIPPAHRCASRSEEHTSELQSRVDIVCRLVLEKKKGKELPKLLVSSY